MSVVRLRHKMESVGHSVGRTKMPKVRGFARDMLIASANITAIKALLHHAALGDKVL